MPAEKRAGEISLTSTSRGWSGLCVLAVIVLAMMAVVPEAVCALNATYEAPGNGTSIYSRYWGWTRAEIFKMNVSGTLYDAYCLDLYTEIAINDTLTVNGSLAEGDPAINWTAVIYILYTYNYSSSEVQNRDREAAAIQAAIWYFTSEPYGKFNESWEWNESAPHYSFKFQFMSDNMTDYYDGYFLSAGNESVIRDRAFVIINDTNNNSGTFKYPTRINLTSSQEYVLQNQTVNLTATVYDQGNDPLQGITVKFNITGGSGTLNPDNGTTNGSGQVQVNFTQTGENETTVAAWIEGRYGTLLRGDILYPVEPVQNASAITIIPHTIEDLILLPIPELPTVALMGTGLLALIGYVSYRRTKKSF
jgi:hypothetical protein